MPMPVSDEDIDKTLQEIKRIWRSHRHLSLVQLISNSIYVRELFYISDLDLIKMIKQEYPSVLDKYDEFHQFDTNKNRIS